jgi:hypothetical protein
VHVVGHGEEREWVRTQRAQTYRLHGLAPLSSRTSLLRHLTSCGHAPSLAAAIDVEGFEGVGERQGSVVADGVVGCLRAVLRVAMVCPSAHSWYSCGTPSWHAHYVVLLRRPMSVHCGPPRYRLCVYKEHCICSDLRHRDAMWRAR